MRVAGSPEGTSTGRIEAGEVAWPGTCSLPAARGAPGVGSVALEVVCGWCDVIFCLRFLVGGGGLLLKRGRLRFAIDDAAISFAGFSRKPSDDR